MQGIPALLHFVLRTSSEESVTFPEAIGRPEVFHQSVGILPGKRISQGWPEEMNVGLAEDGDWKRIATPFSHLSQIGPAQIE